MNEHLVPGVGAHRLAKLTPGPVEPLTVEEARRLLAAAAERRNDVQWVIALCLGLRWDDVDLDAGTLRVRRQLQRPTFEHGCGGTCGRKPGRCRQRVQHDDHVVDTKSKAGRRGIGLPAPVVEMPRFHKASQDAERERAAKWWHEGGWVFTEPDGRPLNVRTDHNRWKALLADVGVRDARLHDARHTAATMLLLLVVPDRAVMATMGWSHASMAARYQHLTGVIRQDIADRVGNLLWS